MSLDDTPTIHWNDILVNVINSSLVKTLGSISTLIGALKITNVKFMLQSQIKLQLVLIKLLNLLLVLLIQMM